MVATWFWIGTIGMALGMLLFAAMGTNASDDVKHHDVIHFFVVTIAAIAYLSMAMGESKIFEGGHEFYFARYLDWANTTPLLLLSLGLVAVHGFAKQRMTLLLGLIAADVMMIATGFFAGLAADWEKWAWYVVSCGAFLAVLWLIWGPVRIEAQTQDPARAALYDRLAAILSVLWVIYPVIWFFGTQGTEGFTPGWETLIYAVLDLSAKVGFGILVTTGVKSVDRREDRSARVVTQPERVAVA